MRLRAVGRRSRGDQQQLRLRQPAAAQLARGLEGDEVRQVDF
jgi:hypothetical protein